jgi:tetratricopeptide (TPR) repeat protein
LERRSILSFELWFWTSFNCLFVRLAEDHKLKGNAAYKSGKYEEAYKHYTQAIFHNPNCATYWSNRSAALMMLQDYTSALDDCTQAIKLDETLTKVGASSTEVCATHIFILRRYICGLQSVT